MANPEALYGQIMVACYTHPVAGPEALGPAAGTFRTLLTTDAAVAAAEVGAAAVVGPDEEPIVIVMTNKQAKNYKTTQGHKWTNEAMKYLRDHILEKNKPGHPGRRSIELTTAHLGGGLTIPHLGKPGDKGLNGGMDYLFDHDKPPRNVDWKAMIANLPQPKRDAMLGKHHVCRMTLEYVEASYDMKRRHMAAQCPWRIAFDAQAPVFVWDFHVLLSDGTVYRFHTDWSKKTASVTEVKPGDKLPPPPKNGINKSDGRGTYRKYKYGNYDPERHWDDSNSAVAEAGSLVAAVKSAVAEAGAAASSTGAVYSHTVAARPKARPPRASIDEFMTPLEKTGAVIQIRPKEVPSQYEQPAVSDSCHSVARGSDVPQKKHSAPKPGCSTQSVDADAGNEQTHGYGVPSASGATSSQQPIEPPVDGPLAPDEGRKLNIDNADPESAPDSPWLLIGDADEESSDAASRQ